MGGAIYNAAGGALSLVNCTVEGNAAEGGSGGNGGPAGTGPACSAGLAGGGPGGAGGSAFGGAVYNLGSFGVSGCTFAANVARGGEGGGGGSATWFVGAGGAGGNARGAAVWTSGDGGIVNSTVAENQANGGTGGAGGTSDNCSAVAPNGVGGTGEAGAILNGGSLTVQNATIWNNLAVGGAGTNAYDTCPVAARPGTAGASSITAASAGITRIVSSIIGNLSSTQNCAGPIIDLGYNICSDGSAAFTESTSHNATDPLLGGLANYGGPTRTIALLAGSPAADAGDPATCPAADQRGFPRPRGNACDVGAYEDQQLPPPGWTSAFSPATVNGGAVTRLSFTLSNMSTSALTEVWFTNDLPAGVVVSSPPNGNLGCGGILIGPAGSTRVIGRIPRIELGQSCTAALNLRAVRYGVWANHDLRIRSDQTGEATIQGDATLTVLGPEVNTSLVTQVTPVSARFGGTVDGHGEETNYYFEYGLSMAFGTRTPLQVAFGEALLDVHADVAGLQSGQSYFVRLAGYTSTATNYGATFSFLTPLGGTTLQIFRLPEGRIKVSLPVGDGVTAVLAESSDLRIWTPVVTNSGPGLLEFLDQPTSTKQARFFRVRETRP